MKMAALGISDWGLHVLQNPNGTYSFVGSVPLELSMVYDDIQDAKNAAKFGLGIVQRGANAKGRTLHRRVFDTEQEARDFAELRGYTVNN